VSFVTFIIPTLGRPTLARTLDSLTHQSDQDWRAIVCFDKNASGLLEFEEYNGQLKAINSYEGGHAGLVRNRGIDLVETPWTAFVDDDDWLALSYVQKLKGYALSHPQLDLIVFTYYDEVNNNTVPEKRQNKIAECKVGISFAVKTEFINTHNIRFTPYAIEDFRFLDACVKAGAKYWISHDLQYYVGGRGGWVRKETE
jgi:glycosyltransferase involved in cell wall biosynthesis